MEIEDIAEADLAALKAAGYGESDLSMLAETEIQALLAKPGADDGNDKGDPHDAAAAAQEAAAAAGGGQTEAAKIAAAAAAEAAAAADDAGNVATAARGFVVPQYTAAEVPADAAERITALRQEERSAFKELMDGTIDSEAYEKVRDRTEAERETLRDQVRNAAIMADLSRQNAEHQAEADWKRAQDTCFTSFKTEGLDYRDKARPALMAAFNHHLKALAGDAKNENRDGSWFLTEAHKLTKADLGITTTALPGKVPGTTPRGVDPGELPPTLRSVPAAATGAVHSDEFAHMRSLDGVALERAYAALSETAQERWRSE